ncbi:hypothetical protein VTN31DRAFT_715 [Thermomyces dupontii]|uniref:uncharacterized protein n=1 Tax=Talaromyces thermophilus TaxID=28565 RepID=UPI003742009B
MVDFTVGQSTTMSNCSVLRFWSGLGSRLIIAMQGTELVEVRTYLDSVPERLVGQRRHIPSRRSLQLKSGSRRHLIGPQCGIIIE